MLFVNNKPYNVYKSLNESKDSDRFELKCTKYLRKLFPKHSFVVKGGNNKMFSDILVDDSFYIECKMTENGDKKNGAQSMAFGIQLVTDGKKSYFTKSEAALDIPETNAIMSYINRHIDQFAALTEPHTKTVNIELDKDTLARWLNKSYLSKNVQFFVTLYDGEFIIFQNTIPNIKKYFDIILSARYYSNGSKNLPLYQRDEAIEAIKSIYHIKSVRFDDNKTFVTIKDEIESPYIDTDDFQIYLSRVDDTNEYRVMKIPGLGSPRVLFTVHTIKPQDKKDFDRFASYLNHTA